MWFIIDKHITLCKVDIFCEFVYFPPQYSNRFGVFTVLTCLYPSTVQTRLSRDQRPTKPVNRLVTGRGVGWGGGGGNLSAIEILNTVENHEWTIKKKKKMCLLKSKFEVICEQF